MPVALYQCRLPTRAWVLCMLMLLSLVASMAHAEIGCSAGFACGGLTGSAPARQDAQFTDPGSLFDLGQPANGRSDLRLTAYAQQQLGTPFASPIDLDQDPGVSRFAVQAELRPLQISASGRYTLEASARYTPEAKSSDGRFTLKAVRAPEGGCGPVIDEMFRDGFET